jgi:hypothetical protein
MAGLYAAAVKTENFLLFAGASAGYHVDIILLNGQLPPAYQALAANYNTPLALRRSGLSLNPH